MGTVAHVAIASDLNGTLFTIDHNGELFRNRHERDDGGGALRHPGLGVRVGSGWNGVRHLAAVHLGDRVLLAGVGAAGELVTAHAPVMSTDEWSLVAPPQSASTAPMAKKAKVGAPPKLRRVFPGSGGVLYLVTEAGALMRQRFGSTSAAGAAGAAAKKPGKLKVIEADGWADGLALFTNGDGVFFDVTMNGTLRYQTIKGAKGRPRNDKWVTLARGWSRYQGVFSAGRRGIYAISGEGALELRPFTVARTSRVQLEPRRSAHVVGSGLFPWGGLAADIEGYCWPLSHTAGGTVDVKIGTRLSNPPDGVPMAVVDPAYYSVEVRRLRRMHDGIEAVYDDIMPTSFDGQTFTAARGHLPSDWLTNGAGWTQGFSVNIPDLPPDDPGHWRSGVYAARCTDTSGRDFYVSFIVRPKAPRSPFAVIANTNTWNAYNSWGGFGKYTHTYPVPTALPFLRPHPGLTPDVAQVAPGLTLYGPSVLTNSCHLLRAELWVLGWLEDLGPNYAYDMYTDQDLHAGIAGIGDGAATRYKGLILNTHPEYWTRAMYDHVKAYRDQGGSIVYLGGNGIYEEVVPSGDDKHMGIFHGLDRSRFPATCTNEQLRLYCLMRSPYVNRPEHALLGVGFQNCEQAAVEGQPYLLQQEPGAEGSNPVLSGVTLHKGDQIGATSVDVDPPVAGSTVIKTYHVDGWEVDQRGAGTPPNAYGPAALLALGGDAAFSGEMLCFDTDAGGIVLAGSSLNFGGSLVADANLQRIVQNALDQCLTR